ncbi:MAG TPA: anti-sigma factor antagonist [Kouleothrix sp.]|uniref:anti-sigma factor antagonist n=1 Tax=Kouleothrix sp. TaxID=2779161 RepID=UPI002CFF2CFF|nr:anti-sigma factor antagonist [Kouleothrix sp.]HRC76961.1 anti-sigma factor antagonist [Kouleothrix sp.]
METITLPATLDSLAQISAFIADATTRAGLDDHAAWQVQLAVDEAATNIIQHGYEPGTPGAIELSWQVASRQLIVALRDHGRRFSPEDVPAPDLAAPLEERQAGGLGIYLMSRLMDSVSFTFDDQLGNVLTMTKQLVPARGVRVIELTGRLDAVSSQAALAQVSAALSTGARQILLDLAQVSFLSSSGMRGLLLVRKDLLALEGGELRLCALQPQVHEVFTLTGFTQLFAIHQTRDEALRAFGQRAP